MIQTCTDEYWQYMEKLKPADAPCGRTFDDVDHSTICPHEQFGPKGSIADLKASMAEWNIVESSSFIREDQNYVVDIWMREGDVRPESPHPEGL